MRRYARGPADTPPLNEGASLYLHRSNRMERLVDALAQVVSVPLADAMRAEHIAVSSPGMERWLSMELSKRLGVWAHPAFPFPRNLLGVAMASLLGEPPDQARVYEPDTLLFSLARMLPEHLGEPEFAPLAHYLAEDRHARRRLALARRMAELFDQYAVYRPEEVLQWVSGKQRHFQARLFAELQKVHGPMHAAAHAQACLSALATLPRDQVRARLLSALPERVSIFGVSTLPPLYVQLLASLGEHIDVHVFLLSPSREYYGDVRSQRELDAMRRRDDGVPEVDIEAMELGEGHPLLASLGRHGRELQVVFEDVGRYQEPSGDLYEEPGTDTLLHVLQSDLLELRDRSREPREALPVVAADDDSISVHACHGAMREVEVLHDRLLAVFDGASIEPHEVIVMTPDIESYAPMIDAVFSSSSGRPVIPFRIADRAASKTNAVAAALQAVLDSVPSRMTGSRVLDLLGTPVIRARFGLGVDDVERAGELIASSGVRWGVDEQHRAAVGQPALPQNTWRFGLQRLALGYAVPDGFDELFEGCAPAEVDVGDAELLGAVFALCRTLFSLRERLSTPCSIAQWAVVLREVLATMIVNDATTADEHKLCARALTDLAQRAERCGFDEPVDLAAVRAELTHALEAGAPSTGFLAGGVTFCRLLPMRSIPFQVVCLLGMNDGVFPKSDTALGFDLMAKKRRAGDRSRLHDDRQLFLEALLSARQRLLVTYVGHSIHDGKPRPPSVVVAELLEHLSRSCRLPSEVDASAAKPPVAYADAFRERVVVSHPLQGFSPRNFGADPDPRLFSHSKAQCDAAKALLGPKSPRASFLQDWTPAATQPPSVVTLDEVERWLAHPLRAFLRKRLGVTLGQDREVPADREPMDLDAIERWRLGNDMLGHMLRDRDAMQLQQRMQAGGALPLGTVGRLEYRDMEGTVRAVRDAYRAQVTGEPLPRIDVDLQVGAVRLVGALFGVWPNAQLRTQFSRIGDAKELSSYLRHLALCAVAQQPGSAALPQRSVLLGQPDDSGRRVVTFAAPPNPLELLESILRLYIAGQASPLPWLVRGSRVYAQRLAQGADANAALEQAARAFDPSERAHGNDGNDPYVQLCYASFDEVLARTEPVTFAQAATAVYAPYFALRSTS